MEEPKAAPPVTVPESPGNAALAYPGLLRPTGWETWTMDEEIVRVPKVELELRRWTGSPLGHTFGGKALIDFGGKPVFAEVCLYELLRLSGWQARWVEPYGAAALHPRHLTRWVDDRLSAQHHEPIAEPWVQKLLLRIAMANKGRYAGCWDAVAWRGDTVLFAELKRRGKDQIRITQQQWLTAAQQVGVGVEHFLLVEWDFAPEP